MPTRYRVPAPQFPLTDRRHREEIGSFLKELSKTSLVLLVSHDPTLFPEVKRIRLSPEKERPLQDALESLAVYDGTTGK